MLLKDVVGFAAGSKWVRTDVWVMGCELFWGGMEQVKAGRIGAPHILENSAEWAGKMLQQSSWSRLPQNVS